VNREAGAFNKRLFGVFAACTVGAVCFIPYFVPQAPSTSQSWVFGYNNRAGILILLAAIAVGAWWTRGFGVELSSAAPAKPLPLKLLYISLAVVLFRSVELYLTVGMYGGYSESSYQILRLWLLNHEPGGCGLHDRASADFPGNRNRIRICLRGTKHCCEQSGGKRRGKAHRIFGIACSNRGHHPWSWMAFSCTRYGHLGKCKCQ
jgi:hypothetical protein